MSRESVIQPFLAHVRAVHERGVDRAALQQICLTGGRHNKIADGKTAAKYRWHT